MPTSRKRHVRRRVKEQARRAASAVHYEGSYAQILMAMDIQAWLAKEQQAKRSYCAVCKGRVRRKRGLIECGRCGRSMTVQQYRDQQAQA